MRRRTKSHSYQGSLVAGCLAVALTWLLPCGIDRGLAQESDNRKAAGGSFKPNVSPKTPSSNNKDERRNDPGKDDKSKGDKSKDERGKDEKGKDDKLTGFTLEREAAALSFVRQNHPELNELLAQLKVGNRSEYQRVVHELFRTSERLALSREKDPVRYELELREWKLDSRIRLLAARMMMSESLAELQEELKRLLVERTDVQLEKQLLERERIAARLEKLDAAIDKTREAREAQAQESLDKLLKGIQESRPKGPRGKASSDAESAVQK